MKTKKYERLKEQYLEYISLNKLYQICKISKRSALYLIQRGLIQAADTGQSTWRYKIHIDDVITYLRRREKVGSMIPPGAVSSKAHSKGNNSLRERKSFAQVITMGQEYKLAEYFSIIYADYADVLTTTDVVQMTGLNQSTILKQLKRGNIKSLCAKPFYLIPKQYLIEFVSTPRFIEAKTNSSAFMSILDGFEEWYKSHNTLQ